MFASRFTRREFVRLGAIATAVGALAACKPEPTPAPTRAPAEPSQPTEPVETEAGLQGKVRFMAGGYTPVEPTEDNPKPPQALTGLVADFQALYPGTEIEIMPPLPAGTSGDQWRVTQFQGGTAPEIILGNYIRVWQEVPNGWYEPLTPFVDMPNPHVPSGVPGHGKWRDSILDRVWDETRYRDGNDYVVTPEGTATGLFINQDIADEVGISTEIVRSASIWESWAEFLLDLAKIKEAGYEPMGMIMPPNGYIYSWLDGIVYTAVYLDKLPQLWDVEERGDTWHVLDQKEFACGVVNGVLSGHDGEFKDFLDIMKEVQQYWLTGYMGMSDDDSYRAFVDGRCAFKAGQGEEIVDLLDEAEFPFGFTYWPVIDEATSQFAANNETSYLVGGFTSGYAIASTARENGVLDTAVEWLRFLTAPDQWSRIVEDQPRYVPTIQGVDVPEALAMAMPALDLPMRAFKSPDPRLTKEYGEEHRRLMQMWMGGQMEKPEVMDKEQELLITQAEAIIEESEWSC